MKQKSVRYPTIDQYIDALSDVSVFTKSLDSCSLVHSPDGFPDFSSGNFGVVFRVCGQQGDFALKCFTRHQWGRFEAYQKLIVGMPKSQYLLGLEYMQNEILVALYGEDTLQDYDAVVMDYIEGETLSEVITQSVMQNDYKTLRTLSRRFDRMALWLLDTDFAHGDLKPDNVMVTKDLELYLVDYDGVYIPLMEGEEQREFGTDSFQHPMRHTAQFDRNIDDYSIALICVTLRVLAVDIDIFLRFCVSGSEGIVVPSEAVCGMSDSLDFISECGIIDSALLGCLGSSQTGIVGLRDVIASGVVGVEEGDATSSGLFVFREGDRYGFSRQDGEVVVPAHYDSAGDFVCGLSVVGCEGRFGAVDCSGVEVIGLEWERMWNFSEAEGLALVRSCGRYGYVNTVGVVRIAVEYDYAAPFSEGYAVVMVGGRYGYINTQGGWVVEPKYDYARSVRGGEFCVERGGEVFVFRATDL